MPEWVRVVLLVVAVVAAPALWVLLVWLVLFLLTGRKDAS